MTILAFILHFLGKASDKKFSKNPRKPNLEPF